MHYSALVTVVLGLQGLGSRDGSDLVRRRVGAWLLVPLVAVPTLVPIQTGMLETGILGRQCWQTWSAILARMHCAAICYTNQHTAFSPLVYADGWTLAVWCL